MKSKETNRKGAKLSVKVAALAAACAIASPAFSAASDQDQWRNVSSAGDAQQTESSSDSSLTDSSSSESSMSDSSAADSAVGELAGQQDNLKTFVKAVEAAGLTEALSDSTYTVFAPTDEAFEASGKDVEELLKPENRQELVSLLRAHIVADDLDEEMTKEIDQAKTIDGGIVDISHDGDKLMVGDATVADAGLEEGDLRIYAIDQVLTPNPEMAAATDSSSDSSEKPDFAALDQDGNGYLDESELNAQDQIDVDFSELDTDADDQLSETEFAAFETRSDDADTEDAGWSSDDDSSRN